LKFFFKIVRGEHRKEGVFIRGKAQIGRGAKIKGNSGSKKTKVDEFLISKREWCLLS
jgi:hypothetical protein